MGAHCLHLYLKLLTSSIHDRPHVHCLWFYNVLHMGKVCQEECRDPVTMHKFEEFLLSTADYSCPPPFLILNNSFLRTNKYLSPFSLRRSLSQYIFISIFNYFLVYVFYSFIFHFISPTFFFSFSLHKHNSYCFLMYAHKLIFRTFFFPSNIIIF